MSDFLITSSLEPVSKGQRIESGPLPLHVTVVQWFELEYPLAFINALQNLATTIDPFEVVVGKDALFGAREDTPVRVLDRIGRLAHIHTKATALIERMGGSIRNPEWAGGRYNPHVTLVNGIGPETGERLQLSTLELVRRDDTGVKIYEQVLGMRALQKGSVRV